MPKTLRCDPKLLRKNLNGRVYIVTGANSGTGLATSEQLLRQGAHVVGACRRVNAGEEAFAGFTRLPGSAEIMKLDLASLDSVRQFGEEFLARHERLDALVNNAGLVTSEGRSEDGFEIQFATNHLGHFLLTELLLDILKASAPSRIVCLSSVVHAGRGNQPVTIDFDDLHFDRKRYSAMAAYAQSKLANVLHAKELARRLDGADVTAYSVHPGWIRSNFGAGIMPGWLRGAMNLGLRPFSGLLGIMSPYDGAQTTLHCLLDEDAPKHNGAYFSQNSILYPQRQHRPGGWPMASPNPNAHDEALAKRLYHVSRESVGLSG